MKLERLGMELGLPGSVKGLLNGKAPKKQKGASKKEMLDKSRFSQHAA